MATALPALDKSNLENYTLIWLDQDANVAPENVQAQPHFRAAINYLKMFKKSDECSKYIRSLTKEDCVVMIVSGRLGQEIVPEVHPLPQVRAIYVYCMRRDKYEQWAEPFSKVNLPLESKSLLTEFSSDQSNSNRSPEPHEESPRRSNPTATHETPRANPSAYPPTEHFSRSDRYFLSLHRCVNQMFVGNQFDYD